MEEIFGLSMNVLMWALLAIFLGAMAVVAFLAWRNRIMLKLGLRNIPRRKTQTVLIIVGIMLSTLITSAAFGTGDTLSFSIRQEVLQSLGAIDEVVVASRATADDSFGSAPYIPLERFEEIERELEGLDSIDGLTPQIGEAAPTVNLTTSLSEGRMRVVGIPPDRLEGFGAFTLVSGGEAPLEALARDEVYINDEAADELDATAGDELRVFAAEKELSFKLKGVVHRGGLAGGDPTLILPLERAQALFNRTGQVNAIIISNRGDDVGGANLSEEVTRRLRVLFTDRVVASQLKELLGHEAVLAALEERQKTLSGNLEMDLQQLLPELAGQTVSDELVSLLADDDVSSEVLDVLDNDELRDVEGLASTRFNELAEFRVFDVKRDFLDRADTAGSVVVTFFLFFSMFSIAVGVLLIFLIFVMLAAARRSEMGMARAVGAQRSHLVLMFVFEGTAYALVSAAIGVLLGLAISTGMVVILNQIVSGFDEAFKLTIHFEPRSAIVAYCLGMVITFATVGVSAYRVSRLNIVAAVRGLPTPSTVSTTTWRKVLATPLRAAVRPFRLAWWSVRALVTIHPWQALKYNLKTDWAIFSFPFIVVWAIYRVFWRLFLQGWLAFLLGLLLASQTDRVSLFGGGVSLMALGIGLTIRLVLTRAQVRPDVRDRIAFTFTGMVILVFWALPISFIEGIVGTLQGDIDVMFVSGIAMVAAAVWVVMYNTDLLLRALSQLTGRFGKLGPVMVTAVAYPLSAKFRTGLTLAMFSLVIFTLVVMSVLTKSFGTEFSDTERVTGGWDIQGSVNLNTPIQRIDVEIANSPDLRTEDFLAIGGYTPAFVQWRQPGTESQRWSGTALQATSDEYLDATRHEFKLIANGYGPTSAEVWEALKADPKLAVLAGTDVSTRPNAGDNWRDFYDIEGLYYFDEEMSPTEIEVRERRSGTIIQLTAIGVLDRIHEYTTPIIVSKATVDNAAPFPVPITNYQFRVAEGVDTEQTAKSLEASFLEHGLETEVLEEVIDKEQAAFRSFFNLFTGFMGLGLFVGIAALGVVSTRAVVERRQQIGVLRAIGYRRGMVQLSFLLESSFVALLGAIIGVVLGIVLGWNAVADIRDDEGVDTIRFSVPWVQIVVILVATYVFSLLATYFPARQASRIYPAEALRYE